MQSYNWYSTNSHKQYLRTHRPQPRLTQYSDEGRYPLGSASDPDNSQLRDQIIETVSEETLRKWVDFQTEMRDKCSLRKRQLGMKHERVDERLRTYPKKKCATENDQDNETQEASDESQPSRIDYDRSKYVLNRKINKPSTNPYANQPTTETVSSDHIFIDVSQPSATNVRLVVSGKENFAEKQVTTSDNRYQVTRVPVSVNEAFERKNVNGISEAGSTLLVTVPASSVLPTQECVLNKYGHCFAPTKCPFSHIGTIKKNGGKSVSNTCWQRKLP
uniref:C3H1-type domain-containing protein n=1 Tax=Caenorhabditis tropicalis TaxID=1561998 RepID=A0A1I7TJX4_9PELO